jgi:hypothetical protein
MYAPLSAHCHFFDFLIDNYDGAVDESGAADRRPESSKALDVVFWVVDLASLGSFLRYLRRLDEVRASVTTDDQWRDHIMRFVKEWEEFNLIVSPMLRSLLNRQ